MSLVNLTSFKVIPGPIDFDKIFSPHPYFVILHFQFFIEFFRFISIILVNRYFYSTAVAFVPHNIHFPLTDQ